MNDAIRYGRLTWKEYRAQRSLWISVFVLTAVLQFFVVAAIAWMQSPAIPPAGHAVIPLLAFSVYMLGCGATLFAIEHEWGTFDYQRLLPATAWQVFATKMMVGLVSGIALLFGLMVLSHTFYIGWRPAIGTPDWIAGLVSALEIFLWAVLFSLVLRHPLRAAICGVLAAAIVVCAIFPTWSVAVGTPETDVFVFHRSFLAPRILLIAVLAGFDSWLGWRWYYGRLGFSFLSRFRRPQVDDYILLPTGALPRYSPSRSIGWQQLLGITWRQGRGYLLLLSGIYVWVFVVIAVANNGFQTTFAGHLLLPVTFASAVVFGICAFTLDQWSAQYRYYAERGVDARWLWLSRHAVWLAPTLVQALGVLWILWSERTHAPLEQFMARGGFLLLVATIYSSSQFIAMFIRSTLVAVMVSIFAAVLVGMWTLMTFAAQVPFWWALVPVPAVFFFTTWKFAPDWIEDKQNRRHWFRVAFVLGLPATVILFGCTLFRAYQIPLIDPGFSPSELTRPLSAEERETLKIYEQAASFIRQTGRRQYLAPDGQLMMMPKQDRTDFLTTARKAIPLLLQAHERPPAPVTLVGMHERPPSRTTLGESSTSDWDSTASFLGTYNQLHAGLLLVLRLHAEELTAQEKLSEAWRMYEFEFELLRRIRWRSDGQLSNYIDAEEKALLSSITHWAAHPMQTKDQLAMALAKLEGNENQESKIIRQAKIQHVVWSTFLRGEAVNPALLHMQPKGIDAIRWVHTFMPWEKVRLQRFLNVHTRTWVDPGAASGFDLYPTKTVERWRQSTVFAAFWYNLPPDMKMPTYRRAARMLVAICDWRREHGTLPENLQLLMGPYFREFSLDPIYRRPFIYSANGFPDDLVIARGPEDFEIIVPKNTSFLWSSLSSPQIPAQIPETLSNDDFVARRTELAEIMRLGHLWLIPSQP